MDHLKEFLKSAFTNFLLFQCNAFLAWPNLIAFMHILLLNFNISVVMTVISIARMDQIDDFLKINNNKNFSFSLNSSKKVTFLHSIIVTNLFYIFKGNNAFYGKVFLIFIVINVPINIRLLLWSVLVNMTVVQRLFILIFIAGQTVGVFGTSFLSKVKCK